MKTPARRGRLILAGLAAFFLGCGFLGCSESPTGGGNGDDPRVAYTDLMSLLTGTSGDVRFLVGGADHWTGGYLTALTNSKVNLGQDITVRFRAEDNGAVLTDADFRLTVDGLHSIYLFGDVNGQASRIPWLVLDAKDYSSPPADEVRVQFIHAMAGLETAVDVFLDGTLVWSGAGYRELSSRRNMAPPTSLRVRNLDDVLWESSDLDVFEAGGIYRVYLVHDGGKVTGEPQVFIEAHTPPPGN